MGLARSPFRTPSHWLVAAKSARAGVRHYSRDASRCYKRQRAHAQCSCGVGAGWELPVLPPVRLCCEEPKAQTVLFGGPVTPQGPYFLEFASRAASLLRFVFVQWCLPACEVLRAVLATPCGGGEAVLWLSGYPCVTLY